MRSPQSEIARAVGLVLASTSMSQALAVNASMYNETTQHTIFVSGSVSIEPSMTLVMQMTNLTSGICADNSLDLYVSQDLRKSLYICMGRVGGVNPLPAALQGTRIAIHKTNDGNAANGVVPLVRNLGTTLPDFWNIATGGALLTACPGVLKPGFFAAPSFFSTYILHTNCANSPILDRVPDAGFSDLEPAMFKTQVPPGQLALSSAELAAIPGTAITATVFAPAVSLNVRDNMQRIRFLTSSPCHPDNAGYSAADETEACTPSLTRSQLAALYAQNYLDWFQLSGDVEGESVASPDLTGFRDLANAGEVFICRRVSASATQAVFETQLLAQRCVSGAVGFASASSDVFFPDIHVIEGAGSGNVISCLATANTTGRGAIGTLSMEFVPNTSRTVLDSGFRFLKMDGVAPCMLPVVQSRYSFYGESTMQWRASAINGLGALVGPALSLSQAVRARIGSPTVTRVLSSVVFHPMCSALGSPGLVSSAQLNLASAPVPPFTVDTGDAHDVVFNPVLTKMRNVNGLSSCLPTIDVLPTQLVP